MAKKKVKKPAKKKVQTQKFIFVTGGVVSSIGKGLTAASVGTLLEMRGIKIGLMKCDPYINVDPGTMSPLQHGEVYVTEDGAETDLDLGHYERFTNVSVNRSHSVTAGQVYESVIAKERKGEYLGGTVQVIPHITNEIKSRMWEVAQDCDIVIIEIGGTVGDIEGLPFIEAIRQMRADVGVENSVFIHVTYVPYIASAGELKSKPTQHSVKELREVGVQPDFLICRSEKKIDKNLKSKISLFCSLPVSNVIGATDAKTIYQVPLDFQKEGLDEKILMRFGLRPKQKSLELKKWEKMLSILKSPKDEIKIGLIGKYANIKESYKSINESLVHGGIANKVRICFVNIDSEDLKFSEIKPILKSLHGILIPGGFGERGTSNMIDAIEYARKNDVPFFGICYGMQLACIELAKNVCKIKNPTTREFESSQKGANFIIDFMDNQKNLSQKGGTMRLGGQKASLLKDSFVQKIYKSSQAIERHRHRYEFNNKYRSIFLKNGIVFSGICKKKDLVEAIELPQHRWFVGVQFHPEFKSKPLSPHPLFVSFIKAALSFKSEATKSSKVVSVKGNVSKSSMEL